MTGDPIPSEHHVAIHIQPSALLPVDENGAHVGVAPSVFRVDEDGISVDWLEYEGCGEAEQFERTCARLRFRRIKPSHRVGIMAVAATENVHAQPALDVIHDPVEVPTPNPGHALIVNAHPDDEALLLELSMLVAVRQFV